MDFRTVENYTELRDFILFTMEAFFNSYLLREDVKKGPATKALPPPLEFSCYIFSPYRRPSPLLVAVS